MTNTPSGGTTVGNAPQKQGQSNFGTIPPAPFNPMVQSQSASRNRYHLQLTWSRGSAQRHSAISVRLICHVSLAYALIGIFLMFHSLQMWTTESGVQSRAELPPFTLGEDHSH